MCIHHQPQSVVTHSALSLTSSAVWTGPKSHLNIRLRKSDAFTSIFSGWWKQGWALLVWVWLWLSHLTPSCLQKSSCCFSTGICTAGVTPSPFRYHLKSQFLQLSSHKGTGLPATHRGGQRSAQSCIGGVTEMQQLEQKRFHPGYRAELQHHELGGLPSMGEQRIQGPGQLPLVQNVFSLKRKKKKQTLIQYLQY